MMRPLSPPPPDPSRSWIRWWAWYPVLTLEGQWVWLTHVEYADWHGSAANRHRIELDPNADYNQWADQRRMPNLSPWAYRVTTPARKDTTE